MLDIQVTSYSNSCKTIYGECESSLPLFLLCSLNSLRFRVLIYTKVLFPGAVRLKQRTKVLSCGDRQSAQNRQPGSRFFHKTFLAIKNIEFLLKNKPLPYLLGYFLIYFAATPPSSPLKSTPPEEAAPPLSSQEVSAQLEQGLAEGGDATVKVPKRFSGLFPTVEELADIKQKKKVGASTSTGLFTAIFCCSLIFSQHCEIDK